MGKFDILKDKLDELKEFLSDAGSYVYDLFKGEGFERASGKLTNQEAKSLGNIDAQGIIALESVQLAEDGLNMICSLDDDLVPMMKKVGSKQIWVTDKEEAESFIKKDNDFFPEGRKLTLEQIEGKCYYKYIGYKITNTILTEFVGNFYRGTSSRQAKTKELTLTSLSTIPTAPAFPAMQMPQGTWGTPNSSNDDEDGE